MGTPRHVTSPCCIDAAGSVVVVSGGRSDPGETIVDWESVPFDTALLAPTECLLFGGDTA